MIGKILGDTLSTIVINVISNCVYDEEQRGVDTIKLNKLEKEIDDWIKEYCRNNDGSILTSSAFQNYVRYQNPILKMYNYLNEVNVQKPSENIFIDDLIKDCQESIRSSGRTFSVEDYLAVRDFFRKVLTKYKEFMSDNLNSADKYSLHVTNQIINNQSDKIIKEVQNTLSGINEICNMIRQEDICEEKKIDIYFSLCDFLWRGDIEEVCRILPLIESRNKELDIAIKMNLEMISDCRFEELNSLEVLENINSDSIKKDIVRKLILLNIENTDLLGQLLQVTTDPILRQIIEEIKNGDFSKFYTIEVEIQHGMEIKNINKKECYDTESWLVDRIIFMYMYKQNNYGIYNYMDELIRKNKNVLEELFIWEKQELEYIDDFSQDGKTDNLKDLCVKLKRNICRYSRIKLEYKKIFYFILIRSAVITDDVEVDNIIENLSDELKEDININEVILLLKIKRGVALQEEIVKFCQSTGRYLILCNFLGQWVNTPEKIINFFENYKYLLSEHLMLFLMYVQMIRITKGIDCSRDICIRYQDEYRNYLEYWLEMFQNTKEKSILDTIVMKRKEGSLLCFNIHSEDILLEIFIQNDMYDDAMEIIRKYEILKRMSPGKLRMKAAILLEKQKDLEALNTFLEIFKYYRDDLFVINNILGLSLQNKRQVPNDIMVYAQKSSNVETLTLVAAVYERESEFELSRKFLTMALLRSDKKNTNILGRYWGFNVGQGDNIIKEVKNVDKDTAVFLKDIDTEDLKVYCIYKDKVLPEEPYQWESAIHIYKEQAIKLGLFRKKVGDCIEIGESKYEIIEIMPVECFLARKCIAKLTECGLAKSFYVDQNLDKFQTQNKLIEWIKENSKSQINFDWSKCYKDFSKIPMPLYSIYKYTKLTYEQFVLAMLKQKDMIIRNMLNENRENKKSGYVLSYSAMIILYKLGVPTKTLNENGVVIPSSILQFSKDEAKTIVDNNARDIVASIGLYDDKLFMNEIDDEEKQYWMEESVKIKEYAEKLNLLNNCEDIDCEEFGNHNLQMLFGICDYDSMAISKRQKREIIVGEATLIIISQIKNIGIYTVDILDFFIDIREPVKNMIQYMKQMLDLRLMVIISRKAVDYISEYYLTAEEKEQKEILKDWSDFLASVESVEKEYKSIFTQISTDIIKSKFSESETYESAVWEILAKYVFHYNGFFFKYGFNENGELEIRTYRKIEG